MTDDEHPAGGPPDFDDLQEEVRRLRFNRERDQAFIDRLQAERNRRVEATDLGKLSEELEADNWGSAATLVRSAMHELEDARGWPARLRALARHLEKRPYAPSLDGYELRAGLRAVADLLDGKPGPDVHPDCAPGSDAFLPRVPLAEVEKMTRVPTPQSSDGTAKGDGRP